MSSISKQTAENIAIALCAKIKKQQEELYTALTAYIKPQLVIAV